MTEKQKAVPRYSDAELRRRRWAILGAGVGTCAALASTLLLHSDHHHYAFFASGFLAAIGAQQLWPWLSGEVESSTFKDRGGF